MKREELKALGLTDEQVEAVMASHGTTVQTLNAKVSATETERDELKKQVKERDKDIETLETANKDNEKLSETLRDLQEKYKVAQEESDKANLYHAIDMALLNEVHDTGIVRGQLDIEKLSLENDGTIKGLDDQLSGLKESKSFLFKQTETEADDNEDGKPNGFNFFNRTPAAPEGTPPKESLGKQMAEHDKSQNTKSDFNPWAV